MKAHTRKHPTKPQNLFEGIKRNTTTSIGLKKEALNTLMNVGGRKIITFDIRFFGTRALAYSNFYL